MVPPRTPQIAAALVEAAMINSTPSDTEIEDWFGRYAAEAGGITERSFLPVAPWIPLIGLPANDG
jgi:hypothetical protein